MFEIKLKKLYMNYKVSYVDKTDNFNTIMGKLSEKCYSSLINFNCILPNLLPMSELYKTVNITITV